MLELAPQVYVSGQLFETDVKLLAGQGVRTIINARPDNETPGQPLSEDLARLAQEHGMAFLHFAVESRVPSEQEIAGFAKVCAGLERPIHLFSRGGARAIRLWEMAEAL